MDRFVVNFHLFGGLSLDEWLKGGWEDDASDFLKTIRSSYVIAA